MKGDTMDITCYYQEPPESKSIEACESHGRDHAAYGWMRQIDPRWSEEQRQAYVRGYEDQIRIERDRS
jgi:hypothetical protein